MFRSFYFLLALLLAACGGHQHVKVEPVAPQACQCPKADQPVQATPAQPPVQPTPVQPAPVHPADPKLKPQETLASGSKVADYGLLKPARWEDLAGFDQAELVQSWPAWLQGCSTLKNRQPWQAACEAAGHMPAQPSESNLQAYYRQYFNVYQASNQDGSDSGMITGYYQPLLKGSRVKTAQYRYPLYTRPADLITVELSGLFPELANKRVRGRLVGNKLLPYYDRAEIEAGLAPLAGKELLWVNDPIELFFLQVQGSGLIRLDNGEAVHVAMPTRMACLTNP